MANPKVNDYEVVFQDVLEDKSLADGMVDLVLSFTKFIGEAQSIFTFEGILVDEVVEGKFSDFLLGRDSVVPDLRSRFGTTATFMVQTYKKIHGHVEGDPFDVIITPVGIGQNLNSTLLRGKPLSRSILRSIQESPLNSKRTRSHMACFRAVTFRLI
jgi:hypothetical protein